MVPPSKTTAKTPENISTGVSRFLILSVLFRKRRGILCFFSVEFRSVCVFRGYSKQNQNKKPQKTFSTRNITEKVIWQNPQQLNQKKGTPVPASTGTLWLGGHASCFEYIQQNRKRRRRSIVSTHTFTRVPAETGKPAKAFHLFS
ncbi:MAG: hypothetical protein O0X96_08895 [Methanocorpusculum sp.]|nr:hypothetical protein [Methanocorpusculum sp.]